MYVKLTVVFFQYGKNIRQCAAYKTHHDIVTMVDKVKMSLVRSKYFSSESNLEGKCSEK